MCTRAEQSTHAHTLLLTAGANHSETTPPPPGRAAILAPCPPFALGARPGLTNSLPAAHACRYGHLSATDIKFIVVTESAVESASSAEALSTDSAMKQVRHGTASPLHDSTAGAPAAQPALPVCAPPAAFAACGMGANSGAWAT